MYRVPSCPTKRKEWIECLSIDEASLKDHHRVCSEHFPNGDQSQKPSLTLGQKFVSLRKHNTERGKRALKRRTLFLAPTSRQRKHTRVTTPSGSDEQGSGSCTPMSASVGEQLMSSSDYSIHESPDPESNASFTKSSDAGYTRVLVNKALVTRIELLEAQYIHLQSELRCQRPRFFRIENIADDDKLVRFYTGFISYALLLLFYEFLGPAVNNLTYWDTERKEKRRKMKLNPLNQFFLTLVKLRLNLKEMQIWHICWPPTNVP